MKKKTLVLIFALLLTTAAFFACGDKGSQGEGDAAGTVNQSQEKDGSVQEDQQSSQESEQGSSQQDKDQETSSQEVGDSDQDKQQDSKDQEQSQEVKEEEGPTVTIQIQCKLLAAQDLSGTGLEPLVPSNGIILATTKVPINEGDTVYDVTASITKKKNILLSSQGTPSAGTLYVDGIAGIFEKDFNSLSGWIFLVNGKKPNISCGLVTLSDQDRIVWAYTLDLGNDL